MKKFTTSRFRTMFAFLVGAGLMTFASFVFVTAQSEPTDSGIEELANDPVDPVGRLADAIQKLNDVLTPDIPTDPGDTAAYNPATATTYEDYTYGCFDDYQQWTSSSTYDPHSSDWNFGFFPSYNHPIYTTSGDTTFRRSEGNTLQQFLDVNGDGLPDYIHSFHGEERTNYRISSTNYNNYYTFNGVMDCVALNTGKGWEIAYQCVYDKSFGKAYGDCAG